MKQGKVIYEIRSGSHLYGTNRPDSDEDFVGLFMPNKEYVLGLNNCDEVDQSVISKMENGKNDSDAIDKKFYNYRKFIRLALDNNPNILEILFANEENILYKDEFAERLLAIRHLFPHKGLIGKFIGYASSQKHKMMIRLDNFRGLEKAEELLRDLSPKSLVAEHKSLWSQNGFKYDDNHVSMGDLCIPQNDPIKRAYKRIADRLSKITNRKELFLKYGYDTKFGSHLLRLLLEGKELLLTGGLEFPLKNRDFLLDVRNGKFTKEQVLTLANDFEAEVDAAKILSKLPSKSRFEEINNFLIKEMMTWINSHSI